MMCRAGAVALAALSALASGGCTSWSRLGDARPLSFAPAQQVQVWMGRTNRILHSVTVDADSLRGIPYANPRTCARCRVSYPRSAVDSPRIGNQEGAGVAWIVGVVAVLAIVAHIGARLGE